MREKKSTQDKKKKSFKTYKNKVMKKQSNLFNELNKTSVENLAQEVKETLAIGHAQTGSKPFGSIDLWNIHRQRRNLSQRRQFA